LICGDHVCINKAEAKQYFEENLSIEVKIIDKKEKEKIDLVELNLKEDSSGKRNVSVLSKKNTKKKLKILSDDEISIIKKDIKKKKKEKKVVKKINSKVQEKTYQKSNKNIKFNSDNNDIVDVCTKLKKCSIEEISKYLLKQGKKRDYPNL
tara:strand:- start:872 stop:1324 length:453 start_codon:yes stop_codon:yes gene_type:complete